jgi:autotransporter translocation and assembly factor TamB
MVLHFERTGDSLRGDVSLDKAKLSAFHPWLPIARPPFGTADAHIVVSGTAANPDVALDLDVHSLGFTDSRKARVAGSGTLRDSLASAVCTLTVQDLPSPLLVQARVPFVPSAGWRVDSSALAPATVSLRGRDIDLGTLVRAYTADASADGSADLDLLLTYTNGLWVPSGMLHTEGVGLVYYPASVTVSNLSVTLDIVPEQANEMLFRVTTDSVHTEYGSVLRSRWDGRLTPNSLRLDSSWVMVDGGGLRLSAAIPFVSPDSLLFHEDLAVSVRSRHFPVVFFNGFSEELEFRDGYIQGSASLRAGRSRFSLDGALKTKDLRVVIPTMAPPLGPVSAEFVFAGDSVSVHSLRAQWGENGSLAGRGAARLTSEGLRNIHMELAGRRLPLNYEDLVEGVVDSVVIVITSGNGQKLGIEGLVTLGETQYEQIVNLAVKQPQPEKPDSSLRDIALDLKLDINRNLTVLIDFMQYVGQTSISTNAKLDGFFAVSGTAFEPILDGEIRVTEGKIIYLDRTFKVESGLVKQTRQRAVNPAVNFVAKTAVRNLGKPDTDEKDTVTLIIRGDLNDPQILLICGGYSETQIIALLTFGRPDLASSIDQTTLGDRAGVLATQQFFGLIERRLNIEGVLGLEELSVEGNIAELGNARVSASKSLGERVRISYTGRVGDREEQRAVVSWELLPFLFLEGGASADGTTGVDAKVRFTR